MLDKDIEQLLAVLPLKVTELIGQKGQNVKDLLEIVVDLDRPIELRYVETTHIIENVVPDDEFLQAILKALGTFGPDNRAGLSGSLHRFSRIVDRQGQPVGLTIRVGRPIYGTAELVQDLIDEGLSVLMLGAPGVGKTTLLRDIARHLSDEKNRRVVIVDTSNEIAGDGRIPHPAVGRSRRLQVPFHKTQHDVMIEGVENHTPQTIIIDEISTRQETDACRTIAQRGVQLIATAHGKILDDVLRNPPLVGLVGGVKTATLGDEEAARRGSQKTVQERESVPVFDAVVEIISFHEVAIHRSVSRSIDTLLKGGSVSPERRILTSSGVRVVQPEIVQPASSDELYTKFMRDSEQPFNPKEFVPRHQRKPGRR